MISMHFTVNAGLLYFKSIEDIGYQFLYQSRISHRKMIPREKWAYQGKVLIKQVSYVSAYLLGETHY